ncbi:MAG: hypothetical protein RL077_6532 [Verrucomicrobiota bacterium]|jgi:hypothetical protein
MRSLTQGKDRKPESGFSHEKIRSSGVATGWIRYALPVAAGFRLNVPGLCRAEIGSLNRRHDRRAAPMADHECAPPLAAIRPAAARGSGGAASFSETASLRGAGPHLSF